MSVESKIITALNPLGYSVYPQSYNGTDTIYYVFNLGTIPDDFGDNKPRHERALIQVHLFCPFTFNSVTLRKNTKKHLSNAGFVYPYMTDASDENGQHWVFECEIAESTDG